MALLNGYDIVAFAFSDWRASWSLPQQIATRLAPNNRVLYVDVPRSFIYFLKKRDPQGAGYWEGPRLQEISRNFFVYHPPHIFLPFSGLPFGLMRRVLDVNGWILARLVRRAMARLGFDRPVVWNFSPLHGMAVERLDASITVYDTGDEWVNYEKDPNGILLLDWIEERLCRQADIVFTGTENMRDQRASYNRETHVVYHAADYAHFSKAALPETPIPEDVLRLPHPIIGTVGVIDPARFDVELVVNLAKKRPNWSIVLVGPARADMDLSPMRGIPNLHILGNRPIADLPSYLKAFDVLFIPYMVNDATRNIYPLKLQEYFATGKPVVSEALPSVQVYEHVVEIAQSHDDFIARVEESLRSDAPELREVRQVIARANSWEHRIETKSDHVLRILQKRQG